MCTGTVFMPSCWAASRRVCPTTTTPSGSTTIACWKPNSLIEAATLAIASGGQWRGLSG